MTYDMLLLFAVLFFATALLSLFIQMETIQQSRFFYPLYLYLCSYLYFTWHWIRGGQTLGMKAWKVKVTAELTGTLTWKAASLRFILACFSIPLFGFGIIWSILDPAKLAFYERYSGTRLVRIID